MNLFILSQRIKNLRKSRGLTLEKVSEATGLTQSVLSKVENFRVTPSLPALSRIAGALGVTMSDLLEGFGEAPDLILVRKEDRQKAERDRPQSKTDYFSLAQPAGGQGINPMMLEIPPGECRKDLLPHEGEEFLLVISGKVDFEYGEQQYTLSQGDSAYFSGSQPHRLNNRMKKPAEILCVFMGPSSHSKE